MEEKHVLKLNVRFLNFPGAFQYVMLFVYGVLQVPHWNASDLIFKKFSFKLSSKQTINPINVNELFINRLKVK